MCANSSSKFSLGDPEYFNYEGISYPSHVNVDGLLQMRQYTFDPEDVLVVSFPKSGTSWMMALVTLILSDGKEISNLFSWVPYREKGMPSFKMVLRASPPNFLATHLPYDFMKDGFDRSHPKVIYVMRNPFDQLVSFYHYYKMCKPYGLYTGSWDEFFNGYYKTSHLFYGNQLDHVAGWWNARVGHKEHILFIKYEDMVRDLRSVLIQVAAFLGKELQEDVISSLLGQLSFKSMKMNQAVNEINSPVMDNSISPFMRKGNVGDWRNYFNEDQKEEVESEYTQKLVKVGLDLDIDN